MTNNQCQANPYDHSFQQMLLATSFHTAKKVVPYVMEMIHPKSVVDIGCGVGSWLAAFRDIGKIHDIQGFDGDYILQNNLLISTDCFTTCNLERLPVPCDRTFDLAVSLEVAEHLPESTADLFVKNLTSLAPAVLFSAALPGQGGTHHVNEQPPQYWAKIFEKYGFIAIDNIRPRFWNDNEVSCWYSQNAFMFIKQCQIDNYPAINRHDTRSSEEIMEWIHPKMIHPETFEFHREKNNRVHVKGLSKNTKSLATRVVRECIKLLPYCIAKKMIHDKSERDA